MKTNKKTRLVIVFWILATTMFFWFSPQVKANEIKPIYQPQSRESDLSLTLKATLHKEPNKYWGGNKKEKTKTISIKKIDWEKFFKNKLTWKKQDTDVLLNQAIIISLSMVVISYNSQPQTVISSAAQTWQWKAWSWCNQGSPVLPPPQGGTTINKVPEPTSLISGLIGALLTAVGGWQRKKYQRQQKKK